MKSYTFTIIAFVVVIAVGILFIFLPKESTSPTDLPTGVVVTDPHANLIVVDTPAYIYGSNTPANAQTPIIIQGRARGTWYFEASFPIELRDSNGAVLGTAIAQAQSDWMTTEFVPFSATLTPNSPILSGTQATLVLKKDNPSGDPVRDDSIEIPIVLQ
jgi:hypothetical protein